MKIPALSLVAAIFPMVCPAQSVSQDISSAEPQAVIGLPLNQTVKQREVYKAPLKSAYDRQIAIAGKDCLAESQAGQQPYNVCMGGAETRANTDFAVFYRNLQMLCHTQDELAALQSLHKAWFSYRDAGMKTAHVVWSQGTGAPAFASQIYLVLVRDHMRELADIHALNIAQ